MEHDSPLWDARRTHAVLQTGASDCHSSRSPNLILLYGTKGGHMQSYRQERPIVTVRARQTWFSIMGRKKDTCSPTDRSVRLSQFALAKPDSPLGTKERHMQSYRRERPIVTVRARQRIHCRNLYIIFNNKTTIRRGTGRRQHKIIQSCDRST